MGIRLQERDLEVVGHLYRARMLTTGQLTDLCFDHSENAARHRLYKLKGPMLENMPKCPRVEGSVWRLTKKMFEEMARETHESYPGSLSPHRVSHLVAANDLYVRLVSLFDDEGLDLLIGQDWNWSVEPRCHRRYGKTGFLRPDAEVLIGDQSFFIERQTKYAKEKPEAIQDKTFNYHRYENSDERYHGQDGFRTLALVWVCDEERDTRAALEAREKHPSKSLDRLGLDEYRKKRMPVFAFDLYMAGEFLLQKVKEYDSQR